MIRNTLLCALILAAVTASAQGVKCSFTLAISSSNSTPRSGRDAVKVDVKLTNVSDHTIFVLGGDHMFWKSIGIDIRNSAGQVPPYTAYGRDIFAKPSVEPTPASTVSPTPDALGRIFVRPPFPLGGAGWRHGPLRVAAN